ncbi:type I-F CRISPR-associated endoribonuclease Cas6/Csy4 [Aquitalea sp. LB_tupeE]|uniref:type I-F CRISPR-associated endoribonuclease Cas6/Csy4 n=1 Tax=Aquitalea sp. LB_tupeE TaxID=2748078 RepID=UPI0015C17EA4|nr:type I-F CRISPR-associated endoribonuclease Cas6/Csy4 [Aquitalea sp. LB_tupeE]NWK79748.1 type I-F CRISPR-associated endoribonuclease Cas6/Csy4 [Aquitalea sp. LB_tupeE]
MDHYLDIRLLPDADFSAAVLLNALYAKLHRALSAQQRSDIGVSFPGYTTGSQQDNKRTPPCLGQTLRLHGSATALDSLMASHWASGFADYALIGNIRPVPATTQAIRVQRRQAKSNPARERARLIRRCGVSAAEALRRLPDSKAQRLPLPFITLDSSSTGQRFLLFIHQHAATQPASGTFNSYGLSSNATLPSW